MLCTWKVFLHGIFECQFFMLSHLTGRQGHDQGWWCDKQLQKSTPAYIYIHCVKIPHGSSFYRKKSHKYTTENRRKSTCMLKYTNPNMVAKNLKLQISDPVICNSKLIVKKRTHLYQNLTMIYIEHILYHVCICGGSIGFYLKFN